jgi:murein L,D-transpeptidase YafK
LATKGDCYSIIVDKSAYNLLVYDGDSLVATFPVELGGDPINPKERLGDGRTPEGSYEVTWRRDIGETIYHRALLLDYPNHSDRQAGRTGSHIEIHGYGTGLRPDDGGLNWTDGCVALSNDDIDSLFEIGDSNRRISNGTPVTIVCAGSLPDERYAVRDP